MFTYSGDATEVERRAEHLVGGFQRPLLIDRREVSVGVSCGVAMYPEHGRDATSLLRAADAALFRAKELGRNRHCVHDPSMLVTASNRFRVEQALRKAIEGGDFVLHYQPQVCLGRQRTIAVEALLRWRRSDNQIVAAGQFIEIAEQSGLMLDLNDWILETAAEAVSNWRRNGWPDARVAINVSAQQFVTGQFPRGHRASARAARFAARSDRTRTDGDHAADRRRDRRGTAWPAAARAWTPRSTISAPAFRR